MLYFKRRLKIYKIPTPFPGRSTTRPGTTQTLKGLVKRMLKNMTAREHKTLISFSLVFDDGHNNGFGFPCDKEGNVKNIHPEAAKNLAWCKEHPEVFVRFNEVITIRQTYTEPAHGMVLRMGASPFQRFFDLLLACNHGRSFFPDCASHWVASPRITGFSSRTIS